MYFLTSGFCLRKLLISCRGKREKPVLKPETRETENRRRRMERSLFQSPFIPRQERSSPERSS